MDETQKKYFRTVCETRSISRAAQQLYISRQSLSASISRVERELGTPLFERLNNGISITPNGEKLLKCIVAQENLWQKFLKEIQAEHSSVKDTVRIAVGGVTMEPEELDYYISYERVNPGVRVEIVNGNLPENIQMLKEGKIDFIASIYTSESPDYLRIELEKSQDVNNVHLLMSKECPLARFDKIDFLNDLNGCTLLYEGSYLPPDFLQICDYHGIKMKSVALNRDTISHLISLGRACLYMPYKYCKRFISDSVTSRPLQHLPLDLHNCILYRRDISDAARKTIHHLYTMYNHTGITLPDEKE